MALLINLFYVPFTFLVAYTTEAFSLTSTVRLPMPRNLEKLLTSRARFS